MEATTSRVTGTIQSKKLREVVRGCRRCGPQGARPRFEAGARRGSNKENGRRPAPTPVKRASQEWHAEGPMTGPQ
jgi:hypothetical protein